MSIEHNIKRQINNIGTVFSIKDKEICCKSVSWIKNTSIIHEHLVAWLEWISVKEGGISVD